MMSEYVPVSITVGKKDRLLCTYDDGDGDVSAVHGGSYPPPTYPH